MQGEASKQLLQILMDINRSSLPTPAGPVKAASSRLAPNLACREPPTYKSLLGRVFAVLRFSFPLRGVHALVDLYISLLPPCTVYVLEMWCGLEDHGCSRGLVWRNWQARRPRAEAVKRKSSVSYLVFPVNLPIKEQPPQDTRPPPYGARLVVITRQPGAQMIFACGQLPTPQTLLFVLPRGPPGLIFIQ